MYWAIRIRPTHVLPFMCSNELPAQMEYNCACRVQTDGKNSITVKVLRVSIYIFFNLISIQFALILSVIYLLFITLHRICLIWTWEYGDKGVIECLNLLDLVSRLECNGKYYCSCDLAKMYRFVSLLECFWSANSSERTLSHWWTLCYAYTQQVAFYMKFILTIRTMNCLQGEYCSLSPCSTANCTQHTTCFRYFFHSSHVVVIVPVLAFVSVFWELQKRNVSLWFDRKGCERGKQPPPPTTTINKHIKQGKQSGREAVIRIARLHIKHNAIIAAHFVNDAVFCLYWATTRNTHHIQVFCLHPHSSQT